MQSSLNANKPRKPTCPPQTHFNAALLPTIRPHRCSDGLRTTSEPIDLAHMYVLDRSVTAGCCSAVPCELLWEFVRAKFLHGQPANIVVGGYLGVKLSQISTQCPKVNIAGTNSHLSTLWPLPLQISTAPVEGSLS